MGRFREKTREARLMSCGHVRRKNDGYIEGMMLRMELPRNRKRGRPKTRLMELLKDDRVEVTEEDTEDRNNWRWKIRCVDP